MYKALVVATLIWICIASYAINRNPPEYRRKTMTTEISAILIKFHPKYYETVQSQIEKIQEVDCIDPIVIRKKINDKQIFMTPNETYEAKHDH